MDQRSRRWRAPRRSAALTMAFVLLACGGDASSPTDPPPPDNGADVALVTVSAVPSSIEAYDSFQAEAEARDAEGNLLEVGFSWSSGDPTVATVEEDGTVRGRTVGDAEIRASAGGITGSARLQVEARDLTALVEGVRAERGLPAMGGAIVSVDGLVGIGVSGTRLAGGSAQVTLEDPWHIGSNLKAVTAALGAVAVGRGAMEWTTTVGESFPELEDVAREEYLDATLEQLLGNAGGVRNDPPPGTYEGSTPREQREAMVAWALSVEPVGPVGSYHYSNPGFVVAGAMIERALGGDFEELLATQLLEPLGAANVGWGPADGGGADAPVGHGLQGGQWTPCAECDNPPGLSAAGRAHMPLGDWVLITREFLQADGGASDVIPASEGRHLFTEQTSVPGSSDGYGLGWVLTDRPWAGGRTAAHSGSNTFNHSVAWLGLGTGIAFIAVTNAADLQGGTTGAALDALVAAMLEMHQAGS